MASRKRRSKLERIWLNGARTSLRQLLSTFNAMKRSSLSSGSFSRSNLIFLIILKSAAHQVARLQQNEDEEELRNNKRSLRNKISELLEDYKAELDWFRSFTHFTPVHSSHIKVPTKVHLLYPNLKWKNVCQINKSRKLKQFLFRLEWRWTQSGPSNLLGPFRCV